MFFYCFLHILWVIFHNSSYSILLALVGLSIQFLYATFFSSKGLRHSSSNHSLLSGFGCYPIVCSAASIIIRFNCFQSSSIWLFSSVALSVSNFPNSSSSCCWNLITVLAPRNASTWSLLVVLFGSYLHSAIFHPYLPLTKKVIRVATYSPTRFHV